MLPDVPAIFIGPRRVAADMPPYVIAEIGLNHGGDVARALMLVDAAAEAGAHAIKLQTIVARELVSTSAPAPMHVDATSMVDFFERFELDAAEHDVVVRRARALGLAVMSTPFSLESVDMLQTLDVDAYKIASGDLTWDELIARVARTGRPVVMSTGMATLAEVEHALAVARANGAADIALLHCVSAYPVPSGSENLLAIRTLADAFGVPVGLSDHGVDAFALPVAVALGGSLYERHLVTAAGDGSIDAAVSSTPAELAAAMTAARRAWLALGSGRKACLAAEAGNRTPSRRSLCARRPIPAGTVITPDLLIALRPATGVAPSEIDLVCGRAVTRDVAQGEPLVYDHFDARILLEAGRVA